MLGRSVLYRAAAVAVLVTALIAALVASGRRPRVAAPIENPSITASASDDLSAELRRCSALGPQDAEDARCVAVWEENRRRFFGRPARPLSPTTLPPALGGVAPATTSSGDAR